MAKSFGFDGWIDELGHFKWDYCSFWCTDGQQEGYADASMGLVSLLGLPASLWKVLFSNVALTGACQCAIGSIRLPILIWAVIALGINTSYIQIFSALILAICLMIPTFKENHEGAKLSK